MEGWWEEKREGEGRTEGVKEGARVRVCVQARERERANDLAFMYY